MNKVTLIGHIGKDPEVRYTTSGTAVASVTLATSEKIKKGDAWEDHTEWHNLVLWGRKAEIAGEYLAKGSHIAIAGKLRTRKWQDKDGNNRYTTEIVVDELEMLGKKRDSNGEKPAESNYSGANPNHEGHESYMSDDDIPF